MKRSSFARLPFAQLKRAVPLGAALLMCMGSASAQLYKWVDAKGAVHYSDKAPPASVAKAAPLKSSAAPVPSTVGLPYELAEAARNHPVILYTGTQCGACEQGRNFLRTRGIPFSEKTVMTVDDDKRLRAAGSTGEIPFLLVGRSKSIGFETSAWAALLSDAGYPRTSMLPSGYQNPAATSAAPAPVQVASEEKPARRVRPPRPVPPPPPAEPTAPPGFRF